MENFPPSPSRSPTRSPRRKSLADAFGGLNITSSKAATTLPMESLLSQTFRAKGWPNWTSSISKASGMPQRLDFTIRMDSKTRVYASDEDPKALYDQAMLYFGNIQELLKESRAEGAKKRDEIIKNDMVNVIFGSNLIERAGLGLEETVRLCEAVFRGEAVNPADVPERSEEDEAKLISAVTSKLPLSHVIRTRREVIQHAKALQFIVGEMVAKDKLLSEEIILETHRILCAEIDIASGDIASGIPAKSYAGRYRTIQVGAGDSNFVNPKFVPLKMAELVKDFNNDIAAAEETQILDPFALAAKYCNDFVLVHPFIDGNGRTCRLILNAILLKYAGIVVPVGEHDEARTEYLDIQKRAGKAMEGSDELAMLLWKRGTVRLRNIKKKLTGKREKK